MILRTLKLRTNYLESDSIALWCLKLVYPWSLLLVFFSSIKMQIFTNKKVILHTCNFSEKCSKDDPICNQRKGMYVHYGKIYDGKSNSCVISVKLYRRWIIVRFLWISPTRRTLIIIQKLKNYTKTCLKVCKIDFSSVPFNNFYLAFIEIFQLTESFFLNFQRVLFCFFHFRSLSS